MIKKLKQRITETYNLYPGNFWVLSGSTFIDRLGGTMLYPFFTLYVTKRFDVGMTEAGLLLAVFAMARMFMVADLLPEERRASVAEVVLLYFSG